MKVVYRLQKLGKTVSKGKGKTQPSPMLGEKRLMYDLRGSPREGNF